MKNPLSADSAVLCLIGVLVTYAMLWAAEDNPHIPVMSCRVETPRDFSADNPIVIVIYSNTSPSNAIRLLIPVDEYEKRMLVPQTSFDGNPVQYSDPEFEKHERIPRHGEWVEPQQEFRVTYAIADRFLVPANWQKMSVTPVHSLQLAIQQSTFDRTGQLLAVKQIANHTVAELREQICRVPRIRKALLEDTLRVPRPPAGAESGGTTTAVPPAAGSARPAEASSRQSGRAGVAPTNGEVKDAAVQPIQTPQGGLPWGILAAGAVVATAAVFALVRSMRNRNTKAEATDN